ncbi:hypothetical protein CYQ88_01085 [Hydrogenovibrio sp. SC-1]|nr:hypothetical protein CYQ88_01085 [Hydrogenovibrio sp. SC-1]
MNFPSYKWAVLVVAVVSIPPLWAGEEEMQRLFLTQKQRADIDQKRAIYLKYPLQTPEDRSRFDALNLPEPKGKNTPRSKLPSPVSVSAVVLLPNGDQLVRINQKFYKRSSSSQSATETAVSVQGNQVWVPVGETYLPDKKRSLKSYQLDNTGGKMDIQTHSPVIEKSISNLNNQAGKSKEIQ